MATQKKATPVTAKARTCAVSHPVWATLIPDQPECKRPTARPASALCATHEKRLPAGWRKRFDEVRAERRTQREAARSAKASGSAKPTTEAKPSNDLASKQIPAHLLNQSQVDTHALAAFASPELAEKAVQKRRAKRARQP